MVEQEGSQTADTTQLVEEPVSGTGVATGSDATDADKSGQDATDAGKSGQQQTGEPVESSFPKEAIDEITRLRGGRRAAEDARIRAEAERDFLLRERQQASVKAEPPAKPEPKQEDYQDTADYYRDYTKWSVDTAVAEALATDRQRTQQQSVWQAFNQREADAAKRYTDYMEVTRDPSITQVVSQPMVEAIATSELGPDLHYYLAKHREESARISQMPPAAAARAIGRIEEKLSTSLVATPTAPDRPEAPFKPISGTTKVDKPLEKLSMEEYAAKWEADYKAGRI